MKKLKLNLDELKVESFEITKRSNNKGTVLGNATLINCYTENPDCEYTVPLSWCADQSFANCPSDYGCGKTEKTCDPCLF